MAQRIDLQKLLVNILGSSHVYFQPPPNVLMVYPCIVYQRDNMKIDYADGQPYNHTVRYQVTTIDQNPDSDIPGKIARLPLCAFDRFFTADQLNHNVFVLYF